MTRYGYCECGCGQRTSIAKKTRSAIGHVKGKPTRYIVGHQQRGKPAPNRRQDPPGLRRCTCCDGLKPLDAFYPSKRHGHRFQCKACDRESRQKWPGSYYGMPWPLRFLAKVGPEDDTGCWPRMGAVGIDGYGQTHIDGMQTRAHRAALQIVGRDVPSGYHTHHRCENKRCVNPEHLEILGAAEHHRLHARSGR